jgi:hypothetical protein
MTSIKEIAFFWSAVLVLSGGSIYMGADPLTAITRITTFAALGWTIGKAMTLALWAYTLYELRSVTARYSE